MSARRTGRGLAVALVAALACGCSLPVRGAGGTTYHLIIGVGVVAVSDPERSAAVVSRAQSLGVAVSDRPGLALGIGYASSLVTTVADGAEDVRIEVADSPTGPLTVDVDRALLTPTSPVPQAAGPPHVPQPLEEEERE